MCIYNVCTAQLKKISLECLHESTPLLFADEPGLEGASSTATLTIQRDRGTFTEVTVSWEVTTSSATGDISPTSGTVTFSMGETTGTFTISALEDEVCTACSLLRRYIYIIISMNII